MSIIAVIITCALLHVLMLHAFCNMCVIAVLHVLMLHAFCCMCVIAACALAVAGGIAVCVLLLHVGQSCMNITAAAHNWYQTSMRYHYDPLSYPFHPN